MKVAAGNRVLHALKGLGTLTLLMAMWLTLTAMSGMPGDDIPEPDKDYKATITDDQDITTTCSKITWDGKTFLKGKRGRGTVTISFEKVKKAEFISEGTDGTVDFRVTLRGGKVVAVTVNGDSRFSGSTDFGSYRIEAKNIKELLFN